jgi:small subunit ribosomal protein S8
MSIVDPISDMLTRIRNAYAVSHETVAVSNSKTKNAVCVTLKENGYISDFKVEEKNLVIELKYDGVKPAISMIERISSPGHRTYVKNDGIPTVLSGHGIAVISTSKGIMTGEDAKKEHLGGELICKVY